VSKGQQGAARAAWEGQKRSAMADRTKRIELNCTTELIQKSRKGPTGFKLKMKQPSTLYEKPYDNVRGGRHEGEGLTERKSSFAGAKMPTRLKISKPGYYTKRDHTAGKIRKNQESSLPATIIIFMGSSTGERRGPTNQACYRKRGGDGLPNHHLNFTLRDSAIITLPSGKKKGRLKHGHVRWVTWGEKRIGRG